MPDWLSHLLMLVAGVPIGGVTNFLLSRRRQTTDEWQAIVDRQGQRITVLEGRCEQLHRELMDNLKALGAADEKTRRLEAQNAAQQKRIDEQQREIEGLRGEIEVLRKGNRED